MSDNKSTLLEKLIVVMGVIAIVAVMILVCTWPFMWLWNHLMPDIFGLKTITFLQSLGLLLLCTFMFRTNINNTKVTPDRELPVRCKGLAVPVWCQ